MIKEGLRLFSPPVYAYRVCSKDVQVGNYLLPSGTTVVHSHYITHRLPGIYPEPLKFIPERWENLKPSPFEYLPFGYGAHACLGGGLANMMMRMILPRILRTWRLEMIPGTRIDRRVLVTLSPKGGMPMKIRRQDGCFEKRAAKIRGNVHEMVDLPVQ